MHVLATDTQPDVRWAPVLPLLPDAAAAGPETRLHTTLVRWLA